MQVNVTKLCQSLTIILIITSYNVEECELGQVIGPLDPAAAEQVRQISKFGVISKGHTPGKWRLIVNPSATVLTTALPPTYVPWSTPQWTKLLHLSEYWGGGVSSPRSPDEKPKHHTIKTYMSAVRHMQIRAGFPTPLGQQYRCLD